MINSTFYNLLSVPLTILALRPIVKSPSLPSGTLVVVYLVSRVS